ncbi:MAG: PAS domain S-box protein [Deltaproteobacteria bacterium]|nr:PAS domain S-box protein [Deltaproteobacteria bacterium]
MQQKSSFLYLPLKTEYTAIWLVAIIGLILSWAGLWVIKQQLDTNKRLDFEWVAHNRTRALKHGIERNLEAVTTVRDLCLASEKIEQVEFQLFVRSLLVRYRGIQALMWIPHGSPLVHKPIDKMTKSVSRQSRATVQPSDGEMTDTSPRSTSIPLYYAESLKSSDVFINFQLGSNPVFRETLSKARATGKMAVSKRIKLGPESDYIGFMVGLPVFRQELPENTPQDENFLGFAVGVFRIEDLANTSVALLEPRGVDVLILDESALKGERYLYFYSSRLRPRDPSEPANGKPFAEEGKIQISSTFDVADRTWSVTCVQAEQFRSAETFEQSPWVVFGTGLLFTVLLSFYLARIKENMLERAKMQKTIMDREELFRQMTENVDGMFWAITGDIGKILYLGPAYEKIWGVPPKDLASQHAPFFEAIPPEDQERLMAVWRRIRRDKVNVAVMHRVIRPDGSKRWVQTRGFPVKNEVDEVFRIVGITEDITEKKLAEEALRESEAKLRALFNQSPDIIMTVDREGKIQMLNRSHPAMPVERAIGRSSFDLWPSEFWQWYRKALKKVFRKGHIKHFEHSTTDSQYWEGRIVPISSDGPVTAAMVIATDVTEKHSLELQALRNARLASIGVLSAGVAHEINNPNNSISFSASLLSRAWQDITPILMEYYKENGDFLMGGLSFSETRETLPRLLSEIRRNSERIKRIVQKLKHMARQEKDELNQTVDIQQVLEGTMMILHNQIQKCTDVCTLAVSDDLPAVKGNSQQLEQVFINLLSNALQALPERSCGIHIDAALNADHEYLTVTVRDEGCGISERDIGRLTKPFFTTRGESGGTGLGLSISQSIVERHGGSLVFVSELGRGTTVTVKIPLIASG